MIISDAAPTLKVKEGEGREGVRSWEQMMGKQAAPQSQCLGP